MLFLLSYTTGRGKLTVREQGLPTFNDHLPKECSMSPDNKDGAGGGEGRAPKTPNTDMQAEDAGTADSGGEDAGRGTAAEGAMKQTSKTDKESGSER